MLPGKIPGYKNPCQTDSNGARSPGTELGEDLLRLVQLLGHARARVLVAQRVADGLGAKVDERRDRDVVVDGQAARERVRHLVEDLADQYRNDRHDDERPEAADERDEPARLRRQDRRDEEGLVANLRQEDERRRLQERRVERRRHGR